jgi:acetylornithine deacetylase/succinyl-diaminopimelate desuccinylase-like protein
MLLRRFRLKPQQATKHQIDTFVAANRQRYVEELKSFLQIPSVSTFPERRADMLRAADFVASQLIAAGMENVELLPANRYPLVYGDWLHAEGKPTVLCYGHYDVQPAEPLELWDNPPFEPVVHDGNIYARGASDDKGQVMTHIKAVEALKTITGGLPVNVKFMIEGQEEIGGTPFHTCVENYREKLKADVALVSDTTLWDETTPAIYLGLRGLIYFQIQAQGPTRDLHSGLFGGVAPNAVFGLIQLLSKTKDENGMLLVPGAYDGVLPPSALELNSWAKLGARAKALLRSRLGIEVPAGESPASVLSRMWAEPSMDVHGVSGWRFRSPKPRRRKLQPKAEFTGMRWGYTGTGMKTVISSRASAKLSFRLSPGQDPRKLIESFRQFVKENTPKGIQTTLQVLASSAAVTFDPDHPAIRTAAKVMERVFGGPAVYVRSGGSIPVVAGFAEHLGVPSVLMGFGLPGDRLHSPNENFSLRNLYLGTSAVAGFLVHYGQPDGGSH